jgi:hypothetical protein
VPDHCCLQSFECIRALQIERDLSARSRWFLGNFLSSNSCARMYDNSGNYVPTSYDNAASLCSSYEVTAFTTQGNSFLAYLAGFCTDTLYAPPGTVVVTTTSVAGGAGGSTVTQATVS